MMADAATNNGGALATAAGQQTASTVGGGSGGALDPNVIPQWKKELIQRRKNLAKTIGAVATQVHDSASTVAAAISASSPVQTHPRTPTGGFPVGSPFYAGTGTKDTLSTNTSSPLDGTVPDSETLHHSCQVENEHDKHSLTQLLKPNNDTIPPSVNAQRAVSSPTATTPGSFTGVHYGANEHLQQQHNNNNHHHHQQQHHQQPHRGSVGGGARATASEAVVVQPTASGPSPTSLPTANGAHSHSNAGSEHSGSSAAIVTATNRTGSGNSGVIVERESSSTVCNSAVVVSNSSSGNNNSGKSVVLGVNGQTQQQQQPNSRDGVAARKMVAATAAEEIVVVYEKNTVLGGGLDATGGGVVGGGGGIGAIGDAGEELKYGPGIVSRLRCRYLSLALRQSVTKQRPSLNSMRRATSLNNLLDEESEDLSEREQSIGSEGTGGGGGVGHQQKKYQTQNYHHYHHQQQQQQQLPQREHYSNGNGNNHNHNHNHHQQQQQQLHPTVVLQPPYQKQQHHFAPKQQPWIQQQQHKEDDQQQQQQGGGVVKTAQFLRGVQNSYARASRQVEKKNEYNRYTKHHRGASGADAVLLKRARSVEALVRYDHKAWERDGTNPVAPAIATAPAPAALAVSSSAEVGSNVIILDEIAQATTTVAATTPAGTEVHGTTNGISSSVSPTAMLMNGKGTAGGPGGTPELPLLVSDCVTIEEKIINGREKGDPKPKRLTSIIDADERPPPDVVKQTMKIFEANANRRGGRGATGTNNAGSEVATKVASYRSIIISGSATAGAQTAAAAVSAAVGPGDKPPITHPKPPLSPKKPNIKPRTASPKQQQHQATSAKPPPTPKSLEAVNNLKNAPGATVKNNNKPPPMGGGTMESTPPSPPARSKHTTAAALNGSVGVALAKNMQSNVGGAGSDGGTATGTQSDPTDAKTNALKNGSTVRDHHNYENGTTQTPPSTKTSTSTSATLPPGSDGGHQHKHSSNTAQEATAAVPTAAVLASSSPSGICDSPSIQQLTSKLGSLHLATSTPTGAANGTVSSVLHDRRNLEYVTSDEEEEDDDDDDVDGENGTGRRNTTSYTVNPESSESEDARDNPAGGSENDADDDEAEEEEDTDGEQRSVRKISRTAMENIARAGTTTQFRFNGAVKSYLPGSGGGGGSGVPAPSTKPPAPPIPKSRESLAGKANGASSAVPIEVNGRLPPEGASVTSPNSANSGGNNNQHSSGIVGSSAVQVVASGVGGGADSAGSATSVAPSLTRREIEKNQINREKSGEPAGPASSGPNSINGNGVAPPANAGPGTTTGSGVVGGVLVASANNPNNGGASGVAKQTTANNSISAIPDSTTSFVAKWGTGGVGGAGVTTVAAAGQSPLAGLVPARKKVKPPPNHQQDGTNTMVFNFSDRKDVPDYIENDGVIIRPRPRELPKPGESGFVVLGDLTLETSTDPDDGLPTGPPSPCNGEFANAYIVINGKSSMRNKTSRSNKFKIQFDDSLTSTYEYPSETSLLDTNGYDDADNSTDTNGGSGGGIVPPAFADNGLLSHTNKLLSSVPLGSAPFASYTPVKAAIDTTFELGVTRTPSPSAASTTSSTGSNGSLTTSNSSSSSSNSHQSATGHGNNGEQKQHTLPHTVPNGHHHHPHHNHQVDRSNNNGLHSNGHSSINGPSDTILNGGTGEPLLSGTGEPESIQYLKPASDEQTVNWSQGTRVTDLLF
ncbi:mucin-19 [Anopheles marshallii]|uniref:mucin-19 n=1 Tax=Anopheles marshallii TaxID=1521116 RepID=UPI00237B83D9|nr:mucin-19 [Anopheles marshallii]